MTREKIIHDPVHGSIRLSGLVLDLVDTRRFSAFEEFTSWDLQIWSSPEQTTRDLNTAWGLHTWCRGFPTSSGFRPKKRIC